MKSINVILPFISWILSFIAAGFVLIRYSKKKGTHQLVWGLGLIMYGLGSFCEAFFGAFGWSSIIFRLWYLFGAILVAAWLGQGTMYLLLAKKVAHILMALLVAASIFGLIRVFTADLDPEMLTSSARTGSELSGHAIVTPGVRLLTPFFNLYGTIALVGGAFWSAWVFFRKRNYYTGPLATYSSPAVQYSRLLAAHLAGWASQTRCISARFWE